MGDWANEFRKKFEDDLNAARIKSELALRKSHAVEKNQGALWEALVALARDAVRDINGSDRNFLLLSEAGFNESPAFEIIYSRDGDRHRTANFQFNPGANAVYMLVSGTTMARDEYKIVANDQGELSFQLSGSGWNPDRIIKNAISKLL